MRFSLLLSACLLACAASSALHAQFVQNLVVFSGEGDKFYLILNGEQQNAEPQSNIKVVGLTAPYMKARIVFADNSLKPIDKSVQLNGVDQTEAHEITYQIKNKKGKRTLNAYAFQPLRSNAAAPNQLLVEYGKPQQNTTITTTTTTTTNPTPTPAPTPTNTNTAGENVNINVNTNTSNPNPNNANINMNVSVVENTNTNTHSDNVNMNTNVNADPNGNLNMNVGVTDGVGGENVNMNVNISADPNNFNMNVNLQDGTNTNTHNTNTNTNTNVGTPNSNTNISHSTTVTSTTTTTTTSTPNTAAPSNNNANGCYTAMTDAKLKETLKRMDGAILDEDKNKIAKGVIQKNCISTSQIAILFEELLHESSRLDLAKYAFNYCTDRDKFGELADEFAFPANKEEIYKLAE